MSSRTTLMAALPMVVSAIAAGANTRVVWGGFDTARTNGRTIWMPNLPLKDDDVEAYALGFAVHETGHIVGTDFTQDPGTGFERCLFMILEDARIELERIRTLPGARRWLENLAHALLRDGKIGNADPLMALPDKVCSFLLTQVWVEALGFAGLKIAADACREALLATVPEAFVSAVEHTAMQVRHARDTAGARQIAAQIIAVLKQLQQQFQDQAEAHGDEGEGQAVDESGDSTQPGDPGDGQDGECEGPDREGDAESAGQTEEPEEPDGGPAAGSEANGEEADNATGRAQRADSTQQAPAGEAGEGDFDSSAAGADQQDAVAPESGEPSGHGSAAHVMPDSGGTHDVEQQPDASSIAQLLQDLIDAGECDEGRDIGERIAAGLEQAVGQARRKHNRGDAGFTAAPEVFDLVGEIGAPDLLAEVRRQTTALRAGLHEYVQVHTRARFSNAYGGRHLSRDAGLRLVRNDFAIYERRRAMGRRVDTAIMVMIDGSLSMAGHPFVVARQSGLSMALALEEFPGVKLGALVFGGDRWQIARVVRFGESVRRTAGRFGQLRAGGSTPLAEALMVAHADLLQVDAERHIAAVVFDGQPDDAPAVHEMVAFGAARGIEHVGIGIGAAAQPAQFFRSSRTIESVDELPRTMLDLARDRLVALRPAA